MDKFRVVSYKKKNGYVGATITRFIGAFDDCVQFYINNKAKYRSKGIYLELMTMDYCVKEELICPECHSFDIDKSSGLFNYNYMCNDCGKNFNDERELSGLFGGK